MKRFTFALKKRSPHGFTIVELLIVISVIAILATIGIVTWNDVQMKARNTKRIDQFTYVIDLFEQYKLRFGEYPSVPLPPAGSVTTRCPGVNYPIGLAGVSVCRNAKDTFSQPDSDKSLSNELAKIDRVPDGNYEPVRFDGTNFLVGPYVMRRNPSNAFVLVLVLEAKKPSDQIGCPANTSWSWGDDNTGAMTCERVFDYSTPMP